MLVSECTAETLTLSHELRVDARRLSAGSDLSSGWFRAPRGDPDRHWRMHLSRRSSEEWALHLQLASSEELASLLRRQPRFVPGIPCSESPAGSQTSYILTAASATALFSSGYTSSCTRQVRCQGAKVNFRSYGYLDTLRNYLVCLIPVPVEWPKVAETGDHRSIAVQLTFQVEYHKVVMTSEG